MLQPGAEIDVWVVEKSLGSGGMGSVYRCHNKHASRILAAIKTLEPAARNVPEAEQRFVREAEILFALDHPNVVKVRNIRLDLVTPYLEMEFVEGESLESRLCRGPVPPAEALRLSRQLFDAVTYLHANGIRHRDIKPANLVITKEGVLKLVDFGLASEGEADRITRANTTFGTVSYAPPEWVQPDQLDPELWDVYACGVVMWEMLTARVAFPGSPLVDPRQVAIQIMTVKQNHPPLDPGEGFTDPVRELCKDMTQSNPDLRIPAMKDAFDRITRIDGVVSAASVAISSDLQGTVRRKATEAPKSAGPAARKKTTKAAKVAAPPPRSSGGIIVAMGGVAALFVFLAIVVAGLGAVWLIVGAKAVNNSPTAGDKRDVDVVIEGLPSGTDVALRMGDAKATAVDGFVHRYAAVPVGAANIRWAIGPGCTVDGCPGVACPAWCDTGEAAHTIEPGSGAQSLKMKLVSPSPRDVTLKLPFATDKVAVAASTADGHVAELKDGVWRVPGLLPGRYDLTVNAGVCAPEAVACSATNTCPAGCSSVVFELVVKPGAGPVDQDVAIVAPVAAVEVVKAVEPDKTKVEKIFERPDKPPDVAVTSAKGGKAGRPILQSEFAKWLAKNPEWQRDSAIAAGKADDNYLREWSGGSPPAPANTVVSVSWLASQAYCGSRGGLAAVDAEPLNWDEGTTAPFQEWRQKDGKPAWRRSDGVDSTAARRTESNAFTGFRCAK